ncbi:putative bacteriophage DNA circulation protein, Mu-like protein [Paraburkholderia piptadeniae]|uniref:Bacteriophage DNA circulation protein, Mu-like protein n=1 Tax=Paraburkholderia piptadeniae TaxID=1701573 RepID=A0A1N7S8H5_9BURK|nr:DNA circularization N-terminal domain-containing protein [Paraburkholderia piptadeniae]SIT43663.1 putative bacteriophage DNA circulation protein, Mu-like protein [Paraburkholderia piptadeniae]
MNVGGGAGAVLGTTSGITNLASSLAARLGGTMGSYFDRLRPASFRGLPFVSLSAEGSFGRRNVLHQYPKRDTPWAEDMGRAARRFQVLGFLVGDDVVDQREVLIKLVETEDSGELIHPTYGRRSVNLMDFRVIERWDKGRYFELQFDFVESGSRVFPTAANGTTSLIASAAAALGLSAAADFAARALSTLAYGASVVNMAVGTALSWYTTAKNLVGDARNLVHLVFNLPGAFGRFAGSATVPTFSKYPGAPVSTATTVDQAIVQSVQSRTAVSAASDTLATAAAGLDASSTDAYATAAQGVASALLSAAPSPGDGMRLLTTLANFYPDAPTTSSTIGGAMSTMQSASGDLFRRAAIASVAIAASRYQPTSSDDAAAVREAVTALIDLEIEVAGNQGEDSTYGALRTLRAAVVQDLNKRGAGLASIATFNFKANLPALVLAQRLYRDPSRADELVAQADPAHPAFMPQTFKALSS